MLELGVLSLRCCIHIKRPHTLGLVPSKNFIMAWAEFLRFVESCGFVLDKSVQCAQEINC
eukprot:1964447-Amphidinium_carterae.1